MLVEKATLADIVVLSVNGHEEMGSSSKSVRELRA
jgi:hypothetical protein